MPEKPIVTGILSYGISGKVFHAPFIEANEKFLLKGIVERSKKSAQDTYPNIISYHSVKDLLADPEIELVIVNTPNDTHVEFAKMALEAGKHVLLEKPFAPTVAEAKALYKVAEKAGKQILPYHNRRFDSDFLSLKEVLASGEIGRLIELHIRFDRYKPELGAKLFKEIKQPAAGVLFDLGSHLIDQVLSLFGRPKAMTKIKGAYRKGTKVDDFGTVFLNFENGPNVFVTASLLVADPQASFVVHGTTGSFVKDRTDVQEQQLLAGVLPYDEHYGLEQPAKEGKLTVANKDGELSSRLVPSKKGDYMQLFEEVYQTLREGKPYFVTKDQIIWQLEILESAK